MGDTSESAPPSSARQFEANVQVQLLSGEIIIDPTLFSRSTKMADLKKIIKKSDALLRVLGPRRASASMTLILLLVGEDGENVALPDSDDMNGTAFDGDLTELLLCVNVSMSSRLMRTTTAEFEMVQSQYLKNAHVKMDHEPLNTRCVGLWVNDTGRCRLSLKPSTLDPEEKGLWFEEIVGDSALTGEVFRTSFCEEKEDFENLGLLTKAMAEALPPSAAHFLSCEAWEGTIYCNVEESEDESEKADGKEAEKERVGWMRFCLYEVKREKYDAALVENEIQKFALVTRIRIDTGEMFNVSCWGEPVVWNSSPEA
uniref:Uncharacterized protein n=1 Tax=Noctiluca scintillans TaxID=2966 RepID=A0A7S1A8S0_NOCSC